jgi:dihydrodipicolinate synthase/N-acetylneuraminate lyase
MMGVLKNATVRPPLLPISGADKEVVRQALRKAKYL